MAEFPNFNRFENSNYEENTFEKLTNLENQFNPELARENFEQVNPENKIETKREVNFDNFENTVEKLKEDEISELIASADLTVYERLNPTNAKEAKEEFLGNPDLIHPNYEYGNLNKQEIENNLNNLEKAKAELESAELSSGKRRLLEYLADDCFKKNDFLVANLAYNTVTQPETKKLAAEHHKEANEALYGKPDEGTFYALLNEKIDQIKAQDLTDEQKQNFAELLDKIGPMPETRSERFKPKPETIERFAEMTNEFFGSFLQHIPEDQEKFSSQEMVNIVNEIIEEELNEDGSNPYRAEIKAGATNASADHEERRIYFPEDKTYSAKRARGLIVHELGTHVLRAVPYVDHEVEAFSTGFPNNEEFDEGVAKAVEQAINGKYEDSGIDHYINIGLANFKGKNFREVYEIQCKLRELTSGKIEPVFNAVQRCFRGTGELPNNKDLAYYNGANRVWKHIEDHIDDIELFDQLFLSGKIDYQNEQQEQISYEARTKGI